METPMDVGGLTIFALVMFPFRAFMYAKLARQEECEVAAEFGEACECDRAITPAFLPNLGDSSTNPSETKG